MRGVAKIQLEQVGPGDCVVNTEVLILVMFSVSPGVLLRQINVDPLLKPEMIISLHSLHCCLFLPSPDGSIQSPWNIGCPQNKNSICIVPNALLQIFE